MPTLVIQETLVLSHDLVSSTLSNNVVRARILGIEPAENDNGGDDEEDNCYFLSY